MGYIQVKNCHIAEMNELTVEEVSKLKVVELKNELDARGLSKSGKKDELISRLIEHIENEDKQNIDKSVSKEDSSQEEQERISREKEEEAQKIKEEEDRKLKEQEKKEEEEKQNREEEERRTQEKEEQKKEELKEEE